MTSNDPRPFLTILTPSWNRAHLLPRLYHSISENLPIETMIEWLIVDDGSTDSTAECVASFREKGDFPVRYHRIGHGGKHRALNAGFERVRGDWAMIVDSDDWFLPMGLELALQEIRKGASLDADALFLSMKDVDRDDQQTFSNPGRCVTLLDRIKQDPWFDTSFVLSSAVCQARFPEFTGENYLAPSALLHDLDPNFTFYLSEQVCVAIQYQADGLTRNNLSARLSSPIGNTYTYFRMVNSRLNPLLRLRALMNYGRFWWHCKIQSKEPVQPTNPLQIAILPIAFFAALSDMWLTRKLKR